MSEILATSPRLPDEPETVEGRLADIFADPSVEVSVDQYKVSRSDLDRIVRALRLASIVMEIGADQRTR